MSGANGRKGGGVIQLNWAISRCRPMEKAGREAAAGLPGAVRGLVPRNYLAQDKYS